MNIGHLTEGGKEFGQLVTRDRVWQISNVDAHRRLLFQKWRCVVLSPMGGKQKTAYHLSLCATRRIDGKRRNQNSTYHHKGRTQRTAHTVYHMAIPTGLFVSA